MEEIDPGPGKFPILVKDESHRMLLEYDAAVEEYKKNPDAYAQGVTANAPKGKKTMNFSMPPMGDSEDWLRITHRMHRNGTPRGGYSESASGRRAQEEAVKIATEQLDKESAAVNAGRRRGGAAR